jgi:hypothetical protein
MSNTYKIRDEMPRGLHASVRISDALQFAPGPTICRVECSGKIIHESDKFVLFPWRSGLQVKETDK